ncbi:Ig-like domain repeat protein [Mycolicibacterium sp. P1-5]|uniref:Ig-like domain repeat protein n=1 Tax=Mycolicibacterium sp. P1-5 TaxID=2024617 RepID=UPI0011EC4A9E|nr:Ig-like domain repeat protein [Mycolicibacterium sp. P1-5]KAA0103708.1 Ig-like domain repeat protein [Mycolicibacterium sp. P1-5]
MATIQLECSPPDPQEGEGITVLATVSPAPANATVQFSVDGIIAPTQGTDGDGLASLLVSGGLPVGSHALAAEFEDLDTAETGSTGISIIVTAAPVAPPPVAPPAVPVGVPPTTDPMSPDLPERGSSGPAAGSNVDPFTGQPPVDPFTGRTAADPYTGVPAAADASIRGFIADVYSTPPVDFSGVPQSVQNAILDVYAMPPIDLSGIPQSVQNDGLDHYAATQSNAGPDEVPLPGRSIGEFLADGLASSWEGAVGNLDVQFNSIGQLGSAIGDGFRQAELATSHVLAPVFGALQTIGGLAQAARGVEFAFVTAESGIGFLAGLGIAGNGLDNAYTGFQRMLGNDAETLTHDVVRDAVRDLTYDDQAAKVAAAIADVGVPLASGGFLKLATMGEAAEVGSMAAPRIENAVESVVDVGANLQRTGGSAGLNDWTVFTRPPEITITYNEVLALSPESAVFLGANLEMAQEDLGFLIRGERLTTDAAFRVAARKWMLAAGMDLTGLDAMHPLDSIAAGNYLSDGQGTTFYFGNAKVNRSIGSQLVRGLEAADVAVGEPFTVRLVGFPGDAPTAPPSSLPDLPTRYR